MYHGNDSHHVPHDAIRPMGSVFLSTQENRFTVAQKTVCSTVSREGSSRRWGGEGAPAAAGPQGLRGEAARAAGAAHTGNAERAQELLEGAADARYRCEQMRGMRYMQKICHEGAMA